MRIFLISITLVLGFSVNLALAAQKVVVLGGGVGGMSAAHELAERGFEVEVYEAKDIPGGKARSMPVPGSEQDGRSPLPGEHGFRFFPGFYQHVTDTMKRIPYKNNRHGVYDNLVALPRIRMATQTNPHVIVPAHPPRDFADFEALVRFIFGSGLNLSREDLMFFAKKLYILLTSCEERRFAEYENISWWDFIDASKRSPEYQKYLAIGLTRSLVATKAEITSARTAGYILLQLTFNLLGSGDNIDRVLNGPTNDVWINPWLDYLKSLGVRYELGARIEGINARDGQIESVIVRQNDQVFEVRADYYVAAIPAEAMARLVTPELEAADPDLGNIHKLRTEWMTGMQFYLKKDMPIVAGHSIHFDSPWAITSISQRQFWKDVDFERMGDGRVQGILSIDISDWNTPGVLYGKPAKQCTAEEIKDEALAQLKMHLDPKTARELEENIVSWFLDPGITFQQPDRPQNSDPLLLNTVGSWADRPEAATRIPNLFLASDYVRTYTDLASMEAANEAARRAVNALLDASGSKARRCRLWPMHEPLIFAPDKLLDKVRFKAGLKHRLAD